MYARHTCTSALAMPSLYTALLFVLELCVWGPYCNHVTLITLSNFLTCTTSIYNDLVTPP